MLALTIVGFFTHKPAKSRLFRDPEEITLGAPALETNALVYVAEDQGYFQEK